MLSIFIDWIASSQNATKAYCKWCKKELTAKRNVLMSHSNSFIHERNKNKQNLPNHSSLINFIFIQNCKHYVYLYQTDRTTL